MKAYILRVAAALSQLAHALIGGRPNLTISARAYLGRDEFGWGIAYHVINTVFFWQKDHCFESFMADIAFAKEVLRVR